MEAFLGRLYGEHWATLWRALASRPRVCIKREGDGRTHSLQSEEGVICAIRRIVGKERVHTPKSRSWYDVAIDFPGRSTCYVNIKISSGGCDNAFNKKALVWSLTTLEEGRIPASMSLNEMHTLITKHPRKMRCGKGDKEYFFLYIDKLDNTVLVKSLLDVYAWTANPYNYLQINWKHEKRLATRYRGRVMASIRRRIFDALGTSVRRYVASVDSFLHQ